MQDDYGEDLAEQKMLDYRCQWAYVEALPVIEQMGMPYFRNNHEWSWTYEPRHQRKRHATIQDGLH